MYEIVTCGSRAMISLAVSIGLSLLCWPNFENNSLQIWQEECWNNRMFTTCIIKESLGTNYKIAA